MDPIVLTKRYLPFIQTFIRDKIKEFEKEPARYPRRDATTTRGTWPNIVSKDSCYCQNGAAGRIPTNVYISAIKIMAQNPDQIIGLEAL